MNNGVLRNDEYKREHSAEIAWLLPSISGGLKASICNDFGDFYWCSYNPYPLACATHVGNLQDIGHNPSPLAGGATHVGNLQDIDFNPSPLEGEGARRAGVGLIQLPKAQMSESRHAEFISTSYQLSASIPYWQGPETSSGRQYYSSPADKKSYGRCA